MGARIKKNDMVMVIAGKEKGKSGRVFMVMPETGRVLVEKLNIIKRHTRPSADTRQGGIVEKEAAIDMSNVMLVCPKCSKPSRVSFSFDGDKKVRVCKNCKDTIDKA